MSDVNHVILIGRLTRDAERRENGPISFSIASSRRVKHGEEWSDEASFFEVTYWHKSLDQYLVKGKQVAIQGELVQDRWEKDGQTMSKVKILAQNVQLLGGGQSTSSASGIVTYPDPNAPPGFPGGPSAGADAPVF